MASISSLRDLRTLIPRSVKPVRIESSPFIPCARCGVILRYKTAVATVIGDGHVGFTHPNGQCEAAGIAEKARLDAAYSLTNGTMPKPRRRVTAAGVVRP